MFRLVADAGAVGDGDITVGVGAQFGLEHLVAQGGPPPPGSTPELAVWHCGGQRQLQFLATVRRDGNAPFRCEVSPHPIANIVAGADGRVHVEYGRAIVVQQGAGNAPGGSRSRRWLSSRWTLPPVAGALRSHGWATAPRTSRRHAPAAGGRTPIAVGKSREQLASTSSEALSPMASRAAATRSMSPATPTLGVANLDFHRAAACSSSTLKRTSSFSSSKPLPSA